jgi:UDP-N-acetylmuramoyl-L-alanyl-D-glutamate--2,6-diaminopimelate ligase
MGCEYDLGVLTNITHEHLDFHKTFDSYREAKIRLFNMLGESELKSFFPCRLAVLNLDDPSYQYIVDRITTPLISYSLGKSDGIWADEIRYTPQGVHFTAVGPSFRQEIQSRLVGEYNVSNILAAIATTVVGLKVSPAVAAQGIAALKGIPGRMEPINLNQSFIALVDFAHTPNALEKALRAARSMSPRRLIAVFGSAGLRDREKRRMMAEIAAELADISILTAEDPRTESLDQILEEMAQGMKMKGRREGEAFFGVRDRGEAMRLGVKLAQPGDILIACGKGHEQSMCFGEVEYPWDDRVAMRAALAELLGVPGPSMPFLPTSDRKADG